MTDTRFEVVYDGPALKSGEMDVHALAPALISLGDLFAAANQALNGEQAEISVKVNAEFKSGSFTVQIHVVQGILESAKAVLLGHEAIQAKELAENILFWVALPGGITAGLYRTFKFLKGKKPARIEYTNNVTQIFNNAGNVFIGTPEVGRLLGSRAVVRAAAGVLGPLGRGGIDTVEFRGNTKDQVEVMRSDDAHDANELALDENKSEEKRNEDVVLLTVVKPALAENLKWRFSMGGASFEALVSDRDFIERVKNKQEGFFYGDILVARLCTAQKVVNGKLKVDYAVTKILEHRSAGKQKLLPNDGVTPLELPPKHNE